MLNKLIKEALDEAERRYNEFCKLDEETQKVEREKHNKKMEELNKKWEEEKEKHRIREEKQELMFRYREIANDFYENKEYIKSEEMYKKTVQLCEEIKFNGTMVTREIYKRLAISLEKNKKYEECIEVCKKAKYISGENWNKRIERLSIKIK